MNKTKTASPRARRLKRRRNGANGARHNGAPRKAHNPAPRGDIGSTTSDLAERKRALAFQRSESRYQALFDLGPVAIYSVDTSGVIQEFNRRAAELWGREPALGDTDERFCGSFKLFRPDGSFMPHEQCPMAEVVSGRISEARNAEVLIERPNGSRVTVVVNIRPLRNARGEIAGAINCFYDITERKRTETAISRLAALVQSSHDAIVAKDLNGIITDWNNGAERIFGYKSGEAIGKSILILIPPGRRSEEQKILDRIRNGESIDHYETVRRRKDGTLIDVSLTISPVKDRNGKIIGVSKIARDITKQKQAEQRLAEQARLLDLGNDAILVRDAQDRITYWNRGAEELYGYSAEEALGKVSNRLLRTEHSRPLKQVRQRLERDDRWTGELVHTRKDGKKIIVMSRWALDRNTAPEPTSILETNTDITGRKQAEIALQTSKQLLKKLVQQRTKALRRANTELENEIARRKGLEGEILAISDREQQRLGEELHDGICQHLTAVAFMVRSVALRLTHHRVIEESDLEKIAELVNEAANDARNVARTLHRMDINSAELVVALRDLVDREIWKTPCRLEVEDAFHLEDDNAAAQLYRIAREAVINANKHAGAREIVLRLGRSPGGVALTISDDGKGLPRKANRSKGMGFYIMNHRARSAGGHLLVKSTKRGGTVVSCSLPDASLQK